MCGALVHVSSVVLGYGEAVEEGLARRLACISGGLEETLQHAQERRLAEAPGAAVERHAAPVHELLHGQRLVHVGELLQHVFEALDAYGKLVPAASVNDVWLALVCDRSVAHEVSPPSPMRLASSISRAGFGKQRFITVLLARPTFFSAIIALCVPRQTPRLFWRATPVRPSQIRRDARSRNAMSSRTQVRRPGEPVNSDTANATTSGKPQGFRNLYGIVVLCAT